MDVKTEGVISELGEVISYDKSFSPEPMIFEGARYLEVLERSSRNVVEEHGGGDCGEDLQKLMHELLQMPSTIAATMLFQPHSGCFLYQDFQVARPFQHPWLAKPAKVSKRLRRPRTTA